MPRRNLSVVSKDEDPYRLQRYPVAFQVMLSNGKQAHNARELVKAAKFKGQWLDMARQPIPAAKVREILALTGQRPHANTGRFMPASQLAKLRKLAKRELLARQGKAVVGPMQYRPSRRAGGRDGRGAPREGRQHPGARDIESTLRATGYFSRPTAAVRFGAGEFYPGEDNEIRNVLDHLERRWLRSVDREARAQARLFALRMQINAAPRETDQRDRNDAAGIHGDQLRRAASALALKVQAQGREVDARHRELLSAASELTRR